MGTTLRFAPLPDPPSQRWMTHSLMKEQNQVRTAFQSLTARRQEAAGSGEFSEAGSAPARVNDRSLLEQELEARKLFDAFIVNALAVSRAKLDECMADVEASREVAKTRLRDAGFCDPVEGQIVPSSYTSWMIRRHPAVREANERRNVFNWFIETHDAARQENLRWVDTLAGKLDRLKTEELASNPS